MLITEVVHYLAYSNIQQQSWYLSCNSCKKDDQIRPTKNYLLQRFYKTRRISECLLCPDDHPPDAVQAPEQFQHTSPGVSRVERGKLLKPSGLVCWHLDLQSKLNKIKGHSLMTSHKYDTPCQAKFNHMLSNKCSPSHQSCGVYQTSTELYNRNVKFWLNLGMH